MCLKKNIINRFLPIWIINVLLLLPLLVFAGQNFQNDSYVIILDNEVHINAFISSFRWFGALVYSIYSLIAHNPILNGTPDIIFFILSFATISVIVSKEIMKLIKRDDLLSFVVINLSVVVSVFNVWFCNILSFPECIFLTTVGMLCCFAAIVVFINSKNILHYLLVVLLITCSAGVYQQFIFVFTIYAIVICKINVLENHENTFKALFFRYAKPALLIGISGVLCIVIGKVVQNIFDIKVNGRVVTSVQDILNNVLYFISNQHSFLKGRGFFSTEILTFSYLAIGLIWLVAMIIKWRKEKKNMQCAFIVLSFIAAYFSAYLPGILANSNAARTIFALFSVFALFSIGTLALTDNKTFKFLVITILSIVFVVNIYSSINCELNLKKQNNIDKTWCNQFIELINDYEEKNDITIEKICYCYDSESDLIVDGNSNSISAFQADYSTKAIIEYYSDREFTFEELSEEEKVDFFNSNNWTEFSSKEQFLFNESIVYVCLY